VKEYQLTANNFEQFFHDIQSELAGTSYLVVTTQDGSNTGKWTAARLWRSWMKSTADFMALNGCTMPLMINPGTGNHYGTRPFNADDAHLLFTSQWLMLDSDGTRLSWSQKGHDGMRAATKGERFNAMRKHEAYAIERGIKLLNPRDSEYNQLQQEQES